MFVITRKQQTCCGAIYTHQSFTKQAQSFLHKNNVAIMMLLHLQHTHTLLENVIANTLTNKTDRIVTSNIGCAMRLNRYIMQKELNVPVMHPTTLGMQ